MLSINVSRKTRLIVTIGISLSFFVAEIVVGFSTGSLALIADAFHYLSDIIGFIVALVALLVSERPKPPPQEFTFGWQRATLLGAFFNGVFLLALGVSILVQAIERFVNIAPVEDPVLVLIVGGIGLGLNLISAVFLHEHDHGHDHGADHGHAHGSDHQHTGHDHGLNQESADFSDRTDGAITSSIEMDGAPSRRFPAHKHTEVQPKRAGQDFGTLGVLLHVVGDAINNIGVMISAVIIWQVDSPQRYYADPAIGVFIAIMIFSTSIPLVKKTGSILLQIAPGGIDPEDVKHDMEKIEGVQSVHELHIWRLDQRKSVASAHVVVSAKTVADFEETAKVIMECLHAYGIHSVTLQPENTPPEATIATTGSNASSETSSVRGYPDDAYPDLQLPIWSREWAINLKDAWTTSHFQDLFPLSGTRLRPAGRDIYASNWHMSPAQYTSPPRFRVAPTWTLLPARFYAWWEAQRPDDGPVANNIPWQEEFHDALEIEDSGFEYLPIVTYPFEDTQPANPEDASFFDNLYYENLRLENLRFENPPIENPPIKNRPIENPRVRDMDFENRRRLKNLHFQNFLFEDPPIENPRIEDYFCEDENPRFEISSFVYPESLNSQPEILHSERGNIEDLGTKKPSMDQQADWEETKSMESDVPSYSPRATSLLDTTTQEAMLIIPCKSATRINTLTPGSTRQYQEHADHAYAGATSGAGFGHRANPYIGSRATQSHEEARVPVTPPVPVAGLGRSAHLGIGAPENVYSNSNNVDPNDINGKVASMLAATAALKSPSEHQTSDPATTAPATTTPLTTSSRVRSKFSLAWSKLNLRTSTRTRETEETSPAKTAPGSVDAAPPVMSPVSTIKMRLNEGDNLNRKKIQRVTGGQMTRKPVADDGRMLRYYSTIPEDAIPTPDLGCHYGPIHDPFAEVASAGIPVKSTTYHASSQRGHVAITTGMRRDPFESEWDLDSDLEDRILRNPPEGSSTPRIRVEDASLYYANIEIGSQAEGDYAAWTGTTVKDQQYVLPEIRMSTETDSMNEAVQMACSGLEGSACDVKGSSKHRTVSRHLVKKHPSPSKGALEDLEAAFRYYSLMHGIETDHDEKDELAPSPEPSNHNLVTPDNNQAFGEYPRSAMRGVPATTILRGTPPYCHKRSLAMCGQPRFGPPFRPRVPGADHSDELK